MKKQSKKKTRDAQLEEFEKKDLGRSVRESASAYVVRPKIRQMPTSLLLDPAFIAKLKEKAAKRGIGYQTMLKIIAYEHIDDY
ncbi:MAG: hypothetical protein HYT79_05980 [Elusimicrobia bacterium]|nr:hypothetical protein [Elusimicrobiota bacterium]